MQMHFDAQFGNGLGPESEGVVNLLEMSKLQCFVCDNVTWAFIGYQKHIDELRCINCHSTLIQIGNREQEDVNIQKIIKENY